jgi:hypothetical protein
LIPASSTAASSSRPAGPTKRPALLVFLVTGLFTHQHDYRAFAAFSEHSLRGVLVEIAVLTMLCFRG